RLDQLGRAFHDLHQLVDDMHVVVVDLVVEAVDEAGQLDVEGNEGGEALADHGGRQVGQAPELPGDREQRRPGQVDGVLGDLLGQVAHALQVDNDHHGGGDAAQVDGHRLVERQHLEALLVDVVFLVVDLHLAVDDLAGHLDVALGQGADGLED